MLFKRGSAAVLAVVLGLSVLAGVGGAPERLSAASNMVPNYEVKLLLDPSKVLGSDHKLTGSVKTAFGMPDSVTKMNVEFLDTNAKVIYSNGWSTRVRKMEGENNFELSYKKRYPIENGNIDAALALANQEGFDSSDTNYEAQVEWGYQKKTLSISRSKSDSKSGYSGMDLPSLSDSRKLLSKNAPGKFDDWLFEGWGTSSLSSARIYGPVLAKRSIGTWNELTLYIEVWPIVSASGTETEYVVEASFKTDSRSKASSMHDELIQYLQSKNWFLAQDSLKTQLIMDRY